MEHFPDDPHQSFILIELNQLRSAGIYAKIDTDAEEVVDVPSRGYLRREIRDRGYLEEDEQGREVPIPEDARLVTCWLGGKIMIVAHGSNWNSDFGTYDGRHNQMTSDQIRQIIQRSLKTP